MSRLPPDADPETGEVTAAADGLVRALPDTLASKIAAGEVVQRPANALKELVENALDAGARQVDVTLRRAGSELIAVADDGCGMGPEDAAACFGRHATSKLRAFEDLERLRTLGFRGEALASIASVAQVELRTRRRQDAAAWCVRVDGGDRAGQEPCSGTPGTTISVRNLFYNVPARRAFLKTPATEFKHLVETFQALALSHPAVGFCLTHDDNEVYRLSAHPGGDGAALAARVVDLLGRDLDRQMVPVAEATSYLSVRGVVGQPGVARRSRSDQFLFVNGRYVKSRALGHAVAQAYGGALAERRHPFFALFLDVDPRHVDVNVHPTKTEVKFDDDRGIYSFVHAITKKALAEAGLGLDFSRARPTAPAAAADAPTVGMPGHEPDARPEPAGDGAQSARVHDAPASGETPHAVPSLGPPAASSWHGDASGPLLSSASAPPRAEPDAAGTSRSVAARVTPARGGPIPSRAAAPAGAFSDRDALELDAALDAAPDRALWELHGRYLLSPVRSGLLVVDQRAAHERILYENALRAMDSGIAPSQQLLFPFTVELRPDDLALLDELGGELRALGFDFETTRGGVLVRGLPSDVTLGDEREALGDLLARYRRDASLAAGPRDAIARSLARRSAVRPGQTMHPEQARGLIDQLFACSDPFTDPAGRPTMIRLGSDEIERRFTQR